MQRITEEQKQKAIEEYARTGNMSIAADAVGLNRWTLWAETKRSIAFKRELDNAKAIYTDRLEAILNDRIGNQHSDDKASAILLMFKLKAEMPDKYRERIEHKVDSTIKVIPAIQRNKPEK